MAEDTLDADLDAMRDEPADFEPQDAQDGPPQDDGQPQPQANAREPLPVEELQRRYENLQRAVKQERAARRALEQRVPQQQQAPTSPQNVFDMIEEADEENDPIGAIKTLKQIVKGVREQQNAEARAAQQQNDATAYVNRLIQHMEAAEADFREEHGDYSDAVQHFKTSYADELRAQGWDGNQLEQKLMGDMLQIVERAAQNGRDPAEILYGLAQKRGYTPGKKAAVNNTQVDPAAERIRQIASGQKQAGGLSSGGSQPSGPLTMQSVANLRGAAFDVAFDKLAQQEKAADRRRRA